VSQHDEVLKVFHLAELGPVRSLRSLQPFLCQNDRGCNLPTITNLGLSSELFDRAECNSSFRSLLHGPVLADKV